MMGRTYLAAAALFAVSVSGAVAQDRLDLGDPEQAMRASTKMFCSTEAGDTAIYWWSGALYSRTEGEKDRHLFDLQGMNIRQCAEFEDETRGLGYRGVSREVMFFLDPESGKVLRTWDNPWTGETVEVVHVANDPVNAREPSWSRTEDGTPRDLFGNAVFTEDGLLLQGGGAARLFYENPLGGDYQDYVGGKYHANEFLTGAFVVDDLLDASKPEVEDAVISWGRISGWLPWMKMGGRPGHIVIWTSGMRLNAWEDLPEVVRNEIDKNYPEYREPPPVDDTRPNETTWTVFKKYIDAKRAAE